MEEIWRLYFENILFDIANILYLLSFPTKSYEHMALALFVKNTLDQRFSNTGTRPGTGAWRPSYRDLKFFFNKIIRKIHIDYDFI